MGGEQGRRGGDVWDAYEEMRAELGSMVVDSLQTRIDADAPSGASSAARTLAALGRMAPDLIPDDMSGHLPRP